MTTWIIGMMIGLLIAASLVYKLLYDWRFDVAINKYLKAAKAGRRPIIVVGAGWFTYRDDYHGPIPELLILAGFFVVDGELVTYHRYAWERLECE